MKRGPRFPWDVKTHQTKTFIDFKSKDIFRLLFQSRKNVTSGFDFSFPRDRRVDTKNDRPSLKDIKSGLAQREKPVKVRFI